MHTENNIVKNYHIPSSISDHHPETERSDSLQEIVSGKPDFLVNWGNTFFLVLLIFVVLACWFIQYPDLVQATAKMTSINAPKPIISYTNGKLVKLTVSEGQMVNRGQVLAYIESTGSHDAVLSLASSLDSLRKILSNGDLTRVEKYFISPPFNLGELQSNYQSFQQDWLTYKNFIEGGFFLKKREILMKEKHILQKLHKNLEEQKELQEQDLDLTQRTFEANESLKRERVISEFDYRIERSKLINKKLSIRQIQTALLSNESQQSDKEKEIMELENSINQQKSLFYESLNTFMSRVNEWLRLYVVASPLEGRIAFESFVQENEQLSTNQVLFFINPENSQYFAEIVIPQSNFGKVKVDQRVLLRFQSYPFEEYGSVIGKIEFINHIPNRENAYLAKVNLIDGLKTTYGKKVQFYNGLTADAQIITNDLRLIERFYYNTVGKLKR